MNKSLLQFVGPSPNSLFNCHNPKGIKYELRLRLGLSHLQEHKFKHSFQDTMNPFCNCGCEIETIAHFPHHYFKFYTERNTFLNKIKSIDTSILTQNNSSFTKTIFFGDLLNSATIETLILLLLLQMLLLALF